MAAAVSKDAAVPEGPARWRWRVCAGGAPEAGALRKVPSARALLYLRASCFAPVFVCWCFMTRDLSIDPARNGRFSGRPAFTQMTPGCGAGIKLKAKKTDRRNPMTHIIKLTVMGDTVTGDPYPAPGPGKTIKPGEMVKWQYDPAMELQVIFSKKAVLPLNEHSLEDISPYGPFSSLVVGEGEVFGTVRSDVPTDTKTRYFCRIFKEGKELRWLQDPTLGGGIDIPMTPGGGAG